MEMMKAKALYSMLHKARKRLKHAYNKGVKIDNVLDVDCGLCLETHLFPDKVNKLEVANNITYDRYLRCLRIENAIGYLETRH